MADLAAGGGAGSLPPGLTDFRLPLDDNLLRALNGLSSPAVDALATWLSKPLFDWSAAALAMLWLLVALRRRAVLPIVFGLLAVGVSDLVGARVLKPMFHRLRPFDALPRSEVHQVLATSHQGSMPSLHAANAFALALLLTCASPRLGPWVYGLAALIALSRVVGGVHWPSDILAGAIWGTAVGLLAWRCLRSLQPPIRATG